MRLPVVRLRNNSSVLSRLRLFWIILILLFLEAKLAIGNALEDADRSKVSNWSLIFMIEIKDQSPPLYRTWRCERRKTRRRSLMRPRSWEKRRERARRAQRDWRRQAINKQIIITTLKNHRTRPISRPSWRSSIRPSRHTRNRRRRIEFLPRR